MSCNNCLNNLCKQKRYGSYPPSDANQNDLLKISHIFLVVTKNCNMKCKYCFVEQEPENITLQVALDAVEYIAKNAKEYGEIPSINFFGGEPLLRWHDIIVPLTLYIRGRYGKNFSLSMTSNGLLLDEEKLDFMKKYDIGLLFSIDGDKPTQDLNRPTKTGEGSFDILVKKIPMILRYYPNMTFRSTCDHDNVDQFFHNHKFAIENGYNNVFNIVNVFPKWNDAEKEELKRQVRLVGDYYIELSRNGRNVSFSPFNEMFYKIKRIEATRERKDFRSENSNVLGFGRCGIGASKFASVGTDGTLYSCQEMVGNKTKGNMFIIGDIYNGEDNNARLNLIRKFDQRKVVCSEGIEKCRSCKFNPICDGACLINNYFVTGDLNVMPSILCYYYSVLLDEAIRVDKILKEIGMDPTNLSKQ